MTLTVACDALAPVVAAERLAEVIAGRRWVALTGAGMSTDSGIPDYRGPDSPRATPMQYADFLHSAANRRRYWARSYLGWRTIGTARPNLGHRSLATLGASSPGGSRLLGVVTQNVDELHTRAGSRPVVDLHGRISEVVCLGCHRVLPRTRVQERLAELNPGVVGPPAAADPPTAKPSTADPPTGEPRAARTFEHAELRPDGDAVVEDWSSFVVADCPGCGGVLKPHLVFFGESVPRERVAAAYALVDAADVLVSLGSSLTVMSGLRFVRHHAKRGRPVVIVNRGATRGDDRATVRLEGGTSETLAALIMMLDRLML